ncbi:MAG: hemerythrin domain-containing protein [Acidobacteria bacterium]|nr:hemerythrin domain-containing protein [Acidobacteriota bacterium]
MNAIELLKNDHDKVEELFEKVKATEEETAHRQLFVKIKEELETHTHIEETIFYPAIKENEELTDMVLEALEEHQQAKTLLEDLSDTTDGKQFDAKLKVLMEDVEHHVEEEEDEMFPEVESTLDSSELEELGRQMEAEKQDFKKSYMTQTG